MAYCGKCGRQVVNGNGCAYCDGIRNAPQKITGYCGICGRPVIDGRSTCRHGSKKRNSQKKYLIWISAVLCFVLVLGVGTSVYMGWIPQSLFNRQQTRRNPKDVQKNLQARFHSEEMQALREEIHSVDVKAAYLEDNELLTVIPFENSRTAFTEEEAAREFAARGFLDLEKAYTSDANGGEPLFSETSSTRYPVYSAVYVSTSGVYWFIQMVNGAMYAYPISYNLEHTDQAEICYSESEKLMVYYAEKNQILELTPKESGTRLRVINRIDAARLEQLTNEVIDRW